MDHLSSLQGHLHIKNEMGLARSILAYDELGVRCCMSLSTPSFVTYTDRELPVTPVAATISIFDASSSQISGCWTSQQNTGQRSLFC